MYKDYIYESKIEYETDFELAFKMAELRDLKFGIYRIDNSGKSIKIYTSKELSNDRKHIIEGILK